MELSLRIPLTISIIVIVTGIIAFIKATTKAGPFPTSYFIAWIIASAILSGITIWAWLRDKRKKQDL